MCHASEPRGSKSSKFIKTGATETLETAVAKDVPPVDRGRFAFQYLVAMFTIETIVWGFATSFGVLFNFYQHDPRSPIKPAPNAKLILTLVGTINTGTIAGLAPFFSFWIAKKPGIRRRLMFSGLLTCALSIFLSSYSTSAFHILLSQGIGYGVGGCALYYAALSHLPEWFDQRQGFANGLVFTGTGLGGVVFPLILNSLLGRFGAKLALQIVTALFSIPIFLAVFFICPRVSNVHQRQDSSVHSVSSLEDKTLPSSENLFRNFYRCLTRMFWIYIFLNTIQSTAFYLPGLYLPTYIHCLGLGSVTGSALLSILNAGTIFAQLAGGVLSDHYSPFLIGVTSNVLGGTCVLIFWGILGQHGIAWLFVFAAAYGATAGAWTCLYFRVLKHFVPDRELLFSAYGVLSMTRGIGNILGGPISSALVSSPLTDPQQCGGFPKGSFSGLILFTGLVFLISGLIGSFLWLHFRPASALVQDGGEIETKTKEASDSFLNF
ncbi:hypothetical protein Pst134EA_003255 [Puccinia striiformis f. sp. tritici]|uniref:Major facilitator superfamily (MFS) profile domain-containing protein n=1 Tax=Puccinia striiformis f. sp. tritici PST-78 TaxID=1165861 RepID=A0A0L0VR33_9BASI|nr:hypothetical protein Pst134EA_003255 [Puccinia striiformis f. sp. tritici]KAH9464802.1 hypothetical protein Pst134EB_004313 [Puccinia striiformis f. sp. tritici]KAH9472650.1 hypothetical protein Pst134EA_003255 [Puccinia striiformis f. sp. tritici]KNF01742.1 hypothetical protein PSTG_05169 [Puccinia striiformis f. sp. tritici PST-78]KNF01743.1 hypothetical protein, variant [Puccinia striiformis f. sp. tritici PST-78]